MKLKDYIPVILAFLFLAFCAGYTAGLIQQAAWKSRVHSSVTIRNNP